MKLSSVTGLAVAAALVTAPSDASAQSAKKANDIVAVAVGAGQFNTLVAAVKAAGLVETLQGKGPFTVFAPSDAAFAKLPKGTVEALLADKEKLTAILTYHVVSGKVMAGDIVKMGGASPATVNGAPVRVTVRNGAVYVDGAKVVTADVGASNGVIHIIDSVIMPPAPAAGSKYKSPCLRRGFVRAGTGCPHERVSPRAQRLGSKPDRRGVSVLLSCRESRKDHPAGTRIPNRLADTDSDAARRRNRLHDPSPSHPDEMAHRHNEVESTVFVRGYTASRTIR